MHSDTVECDESSWVFGFKRTYDIHHQEAVMELNDLIGPKYVVAGQEAVAAT